MAAGFVQLPPDSTGKRLATSTDTTDHIQKVQEAYLAPVGFSLWAGADGAGVAGVTAIALLSLTPVRDAVAGAAATSIAVTAGKRLRLVSANFSVRNSTAAANWTRFAVRYNPGGAVATTSPILFVVEVGTIAALAGTTQNVVAALPPAGIDLPAGGQIGVTHISGATSALNAVSLVGLEYTP